MKKIREWHKWFVNKCWSFEIKLVALLRLVPACVSMIRDPVLYVEYQSGRRNLADELVSDTAKKLGYPGKLYYEGEVIYDGGA